MLVSWVQVQLLKDGHICSAMGSPDSHASPQMGLDILENVFSSEQQPLGASAKQQEVASQQATFQLPMQQALGTSHSETSMTLGVNHQPIDASQAHDACLAKVGSKLVKATVREPVHAKVVIMGGKTQILDEQLVAPSQVALNDKIAFKLVDHSATRHDGKEAPATVIDNGAQASLIAKRFSGPFETNEEMRRSHKEHIPEDHEVAPRSKQGKAGALQSLDSPPEAQERNVGKKLKPALPKAAAYLRNGLATKGLPPAVPSILEKKRSARYVVRMVLLC